MTKLTYFSLANLQFYCMASLLSYEDRCLGPSRKTNEQVRKYWWSQTKKEIGPDTV